MVLIDPSYELKNEYDLVFEALVKAHRRFSSGVYMLWYPVVSRARIEYLEKRFKRSGIRNIQRFELAVRADEQAHGMTASGMFVINPPWTLFEKMSRILPKLAEQLSQQGSQCYRCDLIAAE